MDGNWIPLRASQTWRIIIDHWTDQVRKHIQKTAEKRVDTKTKSVLMAEHKKMEEAF
jgi:hypothetical protein